MTYHRPELVPFQVAFMKVHPATTVVYESYWEFAAERLAMYYRRLSSSRGPWTKNAVLGEYRFTNVFRASDRVSQYLIGEVQYGPSRPQDSSEIYFRTLLFKIFNRIETWEYLEQNLGELSWKRTNMEDVDTVLNEMLKDGRKIYSAAYIMPSPAFGKTRKHSNHLMLLSKMMRDGVPSRVEKAKSLQAVYELLLQYPGLGPFLAFQYAIDLNYSSVVNFDESEFVVAGPGALDGISKCFTGGRSLSPNYVINQMVERQHEEFKRRGLIFEGLFGRALKPIDCQNLFCEISKYARAAHPEMAGAAGRTRIKQKYQQGRASKMPAPVFPPKWKLDTNNIGPAYLEVE